jgi:hypothetical protein
MPDPRGFWMRLLVVLILLLFSIYAQSPVNDRRRAEEILKKTRDGLERQVRERTLELSKSNETLMEAVTIRTENVMVEENQPMEDPEARPFKARKRTDGLSPTHSRGARSPYHWRKMKSIRQSSREGSASIQTGVPFGWDG